MRTKICDVQKAPLQDVVLCSLLDTHRYFSGTCNVYGRLHCVTSYADVNVSTLKIVVPPVCVLFWPLNLWLFIHSLVFSLWGRAGRNQSPVVWPVWLWHTASWASSWG